MKLAIQCLLVITMIMSLLLWAVSSTKMALIDDFPLFTHSAEFEWTREEWSRWVRQPIVQQTTHADETFWVCLCAFILMMKVR